MKGLSIAGTAAMFLVGGGILTHGVAALHHAIEGATARAAAIPSVGMLLGGLTPLLLDALVGIAAGAVVLEGTKIESGAIYGGIPAKKIKDIPVDLITGQIDRIAEHYTLYASWFKDSNAAPSPGK